MEENTSVGLRPLCRQVDSRACVPVCTCTRTDGNMYIYHPRYTDLKNRSWKFLSGLCQMEGQAMCGWHECFGPTISYSLWVKQDVAHAFFSRDCDPRFLCISGQTRQLYVFFFCEYPVSIHTIASPSVRLSLCLLPSILCLNISFLPMSLYLCFWYLMQQPKARSLSLLGLYIQCLLKSG